ncbi:hypothetical protein P3T43_006878 [Paraburkholderia sp. GAS41]|jgi:hypothetical protein
MLYKISWSNFVPDTAVGRHLPVLHKEQDYANQR